MTRSSKCEFGLQKLCFLGHHLLNEGVSLDLHKVHSTVEWATPTSRCEALHLTGLAN